MPIRPRTISGNAPSMSASMDWASSPTRSAPIQEAIEMPRFLSGRFALVEARDTLHIEGRFPTDTIDALAQRGHTINRWDAGNEMAGHAHGITIDRRNGVPSGGSDPRSDGAAIGY
ncbi:gamma-glutamyltransferase [Bradyrhizobium retamae]|uniref:gamma-glutamyltransferase n=1 Tax=Bradyrhizobium retamae TaxID=1300035 RepID=UPI003D31009C